MTEPAHAAIARAPDTGLIAAEIGRGCLRVTGSERKTWLGRLMTSDVAALEPSSAQVGLLLDQHGKILTDARLLDDGDAVLVGTAPGRAAEVAEFLSGYLIMEDVELRDDSDTRAWFELHGADAAAVAARVAPGVNAASAELHPAFEESAALIAVPAARRDACAAALVAQGVRVLDEGSWNLWRVRHGIVVFGVDYDPSDRPHEAGLDRSAVSWTKGCYLGQEVVCMQDMRGKVKRRLALLRVAGVVGPRAAVAHAGETVGEVTSVAEQAGESFVIARLKAPFFSERVELRVAGHTAELLPSPLSPQGPQ
jgi:folate-binding protein YgfZ